MLSTVSTIHMALLKTIYRLQINSETKPELCNGVYYRSVDFMHCYYEHGYFDSNCKIICMDELPSEQRFYKTKYIQIHMYTSFLRFISFQGIFRYLFLFYGIFRIIPVSSLLMTLAFSFLLLSLSISSPHSLPLICTDVH